MLEENSKQHWLRVGAIALMIFIVAFLAFYIVMEIMLHRLADPMYRIKHAEKMIINDAQRIEKLEDKMMENPFVPKMRPMIVNLVKEPNEYKVIVDLKPLDGDENAVNVELEGDELIVSGQMDKKIHGEEKMIKFSQTYYLDEKPDTENIIKERKGDKYIVTIPFQD